MNKRTWLLAAAVLAFGLAGCATTTPAPQSIADTIAGTPELSTLNKLVNDAGMADTLRASGPYTLFAPSNDAFKAVPAETMNALASNKEALKAVLAYHVVQGKFASSDVTNSNQKTLNGASLALAKAGSFVTVEDAMVTTADITATNGVVHVVDSVLMPPKKK